MLARPPEPDIRARLIGETRNDSSITEQRSVRHGLAGCPAHHASGISDRLGL
jgi:hypothetical protein